MLRRAKALGVQLSRRGNLIDWRSASPPPGDFIAALRQHKPELIELLSGNRCKFCGGHIDWREPGARPFADDTAAHNTCWHEAEIDRLLAAGHRAVDPRLAVDPAEVGLHGRPLP